MLLSCTGCRRMSMVQNIHKDAHFCSRGSAHAIIEAESEERTGKVTEASLTRPLYVQNQAVIATSVHLFHRALRHRPVLKADKRKALSDARIPIAADVDARDAPKRAEKFAQVVLLGVLGDVGNPQGWQVVARAARTRH